MKFCVIGLGRFGYEVATRLAENGMEVMAIDSNEGIVASIRDHVTHAICMRVSDEESLRSVGIEEMDTVIVATGENFEQSILITALLRKRLKVPKIIARAINEIHQEILQLVGADQIVLPEREIGIRLGDNLSSNITDIVRLTKHFSISQFKPPRNFIAQKIEDLDLYEKYGIYCIGIKKNEAIEPVDPEHIIAESDTLIFAGDHTELEKVAKL